MSNRRKIRLPSEEQFAAANRDIRGKMASSFGSHTPIRAKVADKAPWIASVTGMTGDGDWTSWPRCEHLSKSPAQTWWAAAWERFWRCDNCVRIEDKLHKAGFGSLDAIEDGTCDGCRRYVGGRNLSPLLVRQDIWVICAALCSECMVRAHTDGARIHEPEKKSLPEE